MTSRAWLYAPLIALAACLLGWPAVFNGQAFFFSDSTAYIRGADAGIEKLTGHKTPWSGTTSAVPAAGAGNASAAESARPNAFPSLSSIKDKTVLAGRSVYYGLLLYLGYVAGNFWLTVWLQAVAVLAALSLALRSCDLLTPRSFIVIALTACVTTAAPYVSFLMPDIFAAITILAGAVLIASGARLQRWQQIGWFGLLTYALLAHSSHLLIAAALLVAGIAAGWLTRSLRRGALGLGLIAAALCLAYLGELAFTAGVTRFLGAAPIRPPFLMARVIDDGPGYTYLQDTCPTNGFLVCRYLDRLPLSADDFLWPSDPRHGVFGASDPQTRRDLSAEQLRFVIEVAKHEPWAQLRASLHNAFAQFVTVGMSEFRYFDGDKPVFAEKLPPQTWASMQRTAAYAGDIPVRPFTRLNEITGALGLAYLLVRLLQAALGRGGMDFSRQSLRLALFVVLGVTANAMICGAMSGAHGRYQARVIWLLPIVALLLEFDLRRRWWARLLGSDTRSVPALS